MDIMLLGPVELARDGHRFELRSDILRRLIATLALEVGRPIALEVLEDRLWDGDPPPRARADLYTYASRARKRLREVAEHPGASSSPSQGAVPGRAPDGGVPTIVGRAHTYTLVTDPDSIDFHRFRRLCNEARTASARGDDQRTVDVLRQAQALWHGEALAGLPGLWPRQVRASLEEEFVHAVITASAAALRLGRFEPLIPDLSELVKRHPDDEQLLGLLMLACHGSRRHGDAVRIYQQVRHMLRAELGTEPGSALMRLYEGVVERRPAEELVLKSFPGGVQATRAAQSVGAGDARMSQAEDDAMPEGTGDGGDGTGGAQGDGQLPEAVSGATDADGRDAGTEREHLPVRPRMLPWQPRLEGRYDELEQLGAAVDRPGGRQRAVALATVSGMPGVGKTAFAIRAAHDLALHYPHGELYIDLRGHSGTQEPLAPETALGVLLRHLGTPPAAVPMDLDERAAMWRSMLAARRCVVVLDDAADSAQVKPMLPGDSASLVIVTSRRHLPGLPDAYAIGLGELPPRDAVGLFRRLAGEERTDDAGEVAKIVRLCGYLPLAIELAATRFRGRITWRLATLSDRLARSPGRLAELRDMDSQQGIIRAFSMSYRTLGSVERRAFRLLSLHPGTGFSAEAAAALLDMLLPQTERLLESLLSCHLLQETALNRYKFHDLLAEYAALLAASEDSAEEKGEAMERLISYLTMAAAQADRVAYPHRLEPAAPHGIPHGPLPFEPNADEARSWFEMEREALIALECYARTHDAPCRAAVLGQYLAAFLDAECHWGDAREVAFQSAEYWRRIGHDAALCRALLSLATAYAQVGEHRRAMTAGTEALRLAQAAGDPHAEAEAFRSLGVLQWRLGEYRQSLFLLEYAYTLKSHWGSDWEKASIENTMAAALLYLGDYETALDYFKRAVNGFRKSGDRRLLGKSLSNMGNLFKRLKRMNDARECFEEAMPLLQASGNRRELAGVNVSLADLVAESGDTETAICLHREAADLFQLLGDRKNEASALNGMGELLQKLQSFGEASRCHRRALSVAADIGAAHEQTVAQRGLGSIEHAKGRHGLAAEHFRRAIELADRSHDRIEGVTSREALVAVQLAVGARGQAVELLDQAAGLMRGHRADEERRLTARIAELSQRSAT